MDIDVRDAAAYGNYPALTIRAALAAIITPLSPGDSITLGTVRGLTGERIKRHTLQVHLRQITPGGWHLVTRSLGENEILVKRVA